MPSSITEGVLFCLPKLVEPQEALVNSSGLVYICITKTIYMKRQSISFTKPNDEWLRVQIENNGYFSKRDVINDLIRQARKQQTQNSWINSRLTKSEMSGSTELTKEEILQESKSL